MMRQDAAGEDEIVDEHSIDRPGGSDGMIRQGSTRLFGGAGLRTPSVGERVSFAY